ncbi:hypothetical protein ABPG77_001394 [Micractinium sp. CCAP 211/92]
MPPENRSLMGRFVVLALLAMPGAFAVPEPLRLGSNIKHDESGLAATGRTLKIKVTGGPNPIAGAPANFQQPANDSFGHIVSIKSRDGGHVCSGFMVNYADTGVAALTGRIVATSARCFKDGVLGVADKLKNPEVIIGSGHVWPMQSPERAGQMSATPPYEEVARSVYGTWIPDGTNLLTGAKGGLAYDANTDENDIALMLLDAQTGPPTVPSMRIPPMKSVGCKAASGKPCAVAAANDVLRLIGYWPTFSQVRTTALNSLGVALSLNSQPLQYYDNANDFYVMQGDLKLLDLTTCGGNPISVPGSFASFLPPLFRGMSDGATTDGSVPAAAWTTNSRVCAGSPKPPAVGPEPPMYAWATQQDVGMPLFKPGATWKDNMAVAMFSYSKFYEGRTPVLNKPPLSFLQAVSDKPVAGVYTDLASVRSWIQDTCTYFEKTYFQYYLDFYIVDLNNNNQSWPGPMPIAAQQGIARYLTNLIQKKPSPGGSPYAVDFYSYKNGRLRYYWTTKKVWEDVRSFFYTGEYNATSKLDKGPFNPKYYVGFWARYYKLPSGSNLFENLANLENQLIEAVDPAGSVYFQIQSVTLNNGYLPVKDAQGKPTGCSGSGINACIKQEVWQRPIK